jgi:aspartate/methionine/tyrosine aminotransferase
MKTAKRLEHIEEYYFSRKLKEVSHLISQGKPIINLGIGSPDLMPPKSTVNSLIEALKSPTAHKYQSYTGIESLRLAIKSFYFNNYNVDLNHEYEILPLIGSKEGIMHISLAFLDEGDEVLIPNPGYPTYSSVTKIVGAKPIFYDLKELNSWLPNIKDLEKMNLSKVKIMWVNYPNMPTGSNCSLSFFNDLISFCEERNILLINDNPYSFILNDNPISLLMARKSKYCLELNSLSKSHNMAGWRLGMVVGSKENISNILKIKSNMDSGMFLPIQIGAVDALNQSNNWYNDLNKIYLKRKKVVVKICEKLNLNFNKSGSGLFLWGKIPSNFKKSEDFIDELLYDKNIFITPGSIFGSNGEGYVRISLCCDENKLKEALKRL